MRVNWVQIQDFVQFTYGGEKIEKKDLQYIYENSHTHKDVAMGICYLPALISSH